MIKTLAQRSVKSIWLQYLRPGWLDEARVIIQTHTFKNLVTDKELKGKCLNAGCGEGLYSEFLESFKEIAEIVNLDIDMPSIPQQRADKRHKAYQGSLTSVPFEDATFDSCLCTEVIEHIEEDGQAIFELARVLKPGGFLLISVPTPPAPNDPAHVREGYTLEELSEILIKSNFIIKHYAYCFHILMRILSYLWQWQFFVIGRGKRSFMPLFLVRGFGYADKHFKWGKPWDLVIIAQKVT
ncbi:class I SAM-dependent methyltransferase [Argonema antarcticum]|uniref:class I SAM-dependent methyltransferase n=1 Tax=Argonema antarcticum TaxID=2942763 RepID=UPI0020124FF4|nr:class I SAM-dependent methyltransferase [Argonema antarcticum]MCL1470574.1 class I SAM-dependent methyltransferase [Argonema antarcticum A004/B2]